jgi:hypothetical protein
LALSVTDVFLELLASGQPNIACEEVSNSSGCSLTQWIRPDYRERRGTQQDDKDRRKDQKNHGENHLDRRLLCFLLRSLSPPYAHLFGLNSQNFANSNTQLVCL